MKQFIVFLLLAALLGITAFLTSAQQNQNAQKPNSEVELLKSRISVLESKLQTVKNIEKMELAAKLADANAKLANAEFGKFKNELRESNNEWLKSWSLWFLTILGVFVAILLGVSYVFWFWLRSRADQLMADRVEMSIDGFKDAVAQQEVIKNQIRILKKEHVASVLEGSVHIPDSEGRLYSETINALPDSGLLDLIADKTRGLDFRYKAAEVLAVRANPKVVSPVLELLNSIVDSQVNWDNGNTSEWYSRNLVDFLGQFHTQEVYEGLRKFLNRLLTENPKHKELFLTKTTLSLTRVSIELNRKDSISMIRQTIPDLDVPSHRADALTDLVECFNLFNEPTGIKEILTNGLTDGMPDVETQCLELLQKHDPEFVKEWRERKTITNTQTEEAS